jgi:thioredoxin-related protein
MAGMNSSAQTIQMNFPHFSGKSYDFVIFQGDAQKTVLQGTIPNNGKFSLKIPKEYAPYTGMSRWLITGTQEGGGLDMVIPGKDFSVGCKEAQPNENNIIYEGNNQVTLLNGFYKEQQLLFSRGDAMMKAKVAFGKTDKNYAFYEEQYQRQVADYTLFENKMSSTPGYAEKMLHIVNITMGIGTEIIHEEEKKALNISHYIADRMDWDALYTSGHWTSVIAVWIDIHGQVIKDPYRFVNDFSKISQKIKDEKKYTDFVGRVAYFLTQQGKDTYLNAIAPLVVASGKVKNYEGSLSVFIKAAVGTQAPDLTFTEHTGKISDHNHKTTVLKSSELADKTYNKTMLIFYESGCGPCENLLQQLPGNYENIKAKGVRIMSISADKDETVFMGKAKDFLWKDSFCDYEGLKGENFKNYAVSGTPTLILIDNTGKILLRTASLGEVLQFLK